MHLIQGFFCQAGTGFGLVDGGARMTIGMKFDTVMFAGSIQHIRHDETKPLIGEMIDDLLGKALLSHIEVTETEIRFLKHYKRGKGILEELSPNGGISYVLHKQEDGSWVGEYAVPNGTDNPHRGTVRCVVAEMKDELLHDDLKKHSEKLGFELQEEEVLYESFFNNGEPLSDDSENPTPPTNDEDGPLPF